MRNFSLVGFVIFLFVFSCGGDPKTSNIQPDEDARSGATKGQEEQEPEAPVEPVEENGTEGSIHRTDLNQVLAAGPAAILGRVQTEPVFNKGKFVGFRIGAFNGEPPKALDLRVGDVVVNINNKSVERPEDFFEVIETLKTAEGLSFVIIRDQTRHTLNYPIIDG